jgi:hypothetical protein
MTVMARNVIAPEMARRGTLGRRWKQVHSHVQRATLLAGALFVAGCSSPPRISPNVHAHFDLPASTVVEVRWAGAHPGLNYLRPKTKGEAAGDGAFNAARESGAAPAGLLLAPIVIPVAALWGTLHGVNEDELMRSEQALTNAGARLNVTEALTKELIVLGNERTRYRWRSEAAALTNAVSVSGQASNAVLVLELSWSTWALQRGGLVSDNPINARLRLRAVVHCLAWLQTSPEKWISHHVRHASEPHKFVQWAASNCRLLEGAAHAATPELSRTILSEMFATGQIAPTR